MSETNNYEHPLHEQSDDDGPPATGAPSGAMEERNDEQHTRFDMFFIRPSDAGASLDEVAAGVFLALDIIDYEERFSSNYPPDEHYFAGYCENATVTVSDADEDWTPDYPFHVLVEEATWRKGPGVIATDNASIARALVRGGLTVLVPAGDWSSNDWNGDGDLYAA